MYRIFHTLLAVMFIAALAPAHAAAGRDPYAYFFDQSLGDFSEELATARDQGKKGVMLFFEMDDCPFCHRMKTTVLNQPDVQAYFKENFLMFPVDIEGDVEIADFHGQPMKQKDFAFRVNRVRATPVIAFYDLDGNQVVRYTGATAGIEEFMWLGEFAAEGLYKDMNFTKFKRMKREEKGK